MKSGLRGEFSGGGVLDVASKDMVIRGGSQDDALVMEASNIEARLNQDEDNPEWMLEQVETKAGEAPDPRAVAEARREEFSFMQKIGLDTIKVERHQNTHADTTGHVFNGPAKLGVSQLRQGRAFCVDA
jgi:hypothetical protein